MYNEQMIETMDILTGKGVYRLTQVEPGAKGLCGIDTTGQRLCVPYPDIKEVMNVGESLMFQISLN